MNKTLYTADPTLWLQFEQQIARPRLSSISKEIERLMRDELNREAPPATRTPARTRHTVPSRSKKGGR